MMSIKIITSEELFLLLIFNINRKKKIRDNWYGVLWTCKVRQIWYKHLLAVICLLPINKTNGN